MTRSIARWGALALLGVGLLSGAAVLLGMRMNNLPRTCDVVNRWITDHDLTATAEQPSISGDLLLYTHDGGVFVRAAGGQQALMLRDTPVAYEHFHIWSPGDDRLMVVLRCDRLSGLYPRYDTQPLLAVIYDFRAGLTGYSARVQRAGMGYHGVFRGWSPDGRYFVSQADPVSLTVWDSETGERRFEQIGGIRMRDFWWSPDGNRLAFLHDDAPFRLMLADITGGTTMSHRLPSDFGVCGRPNTIIWSPDSQRAAHLHPVCNRDGIQLDVYNAADDDHFYNISANVFISDRYTYLDHPFPVGWSDDSARLLYWENLNERAYRLRAYRPAAATVETLLDTTRRPFYPDAQLPRDEDIGPTGDWFAHYREYPDGGYGIDLLSHDARATQPFIARADDLGDPAWHPDGEQVAAVYAQQIDGERVVRLAWMHADGSSYHEFSDPRYIDLIDLHWSPDGAHIVIMGVHPGELYFDVLLIDTMSAAVVTLKERLALHDHLSFDDPVARVTFTWYDAARDAWGFSGFHSDGRLVFEAAPASEAVFWGRAFWSPDAGAVALKLRLDSGEALAVARRDQPGAFLVSRGLSGLGDPVWRSTRAVYFTRSVNRGPVQAVTYRLAR